MRIPRQLSEKLEAGIDLRQEHREGHGLSEAAAVLAA
jgi:hypothetical protein